MPTTGWLSGVPPIDPAKGASQQTMPPPAAAKLTRPARAKAQASAATDGNQRSATAGPAHHDAASTRDRILDIALDLFTEQGFDGTSLRQIAEKVGVTKAALYYHFESKDDILMALHMRLHDFGKNALSQIGDRPVTL